jgi:phosphate-selective porin OprO/OprP
MGARAWMAVVLLATVLGGIARGESNVDRRLRELEATVERQATEIRELREELRARAEPTPPSPKVAEAEDAIEAQKEEALAKGALPAWVRHEIGKGFTFQTADDRFELQLSNRLQARYTYIDGADLPGVENSSDFEIRRMKTTLEGHAFDPSLQFKVQANWVADTILEDAYLHWVPRPYAGIQVGQYKVPFNRQQLTSSGALQFVDRSIADNFFTPARDRGLTLTGSWFGEKHDQLQWNAGIFNGNGIEQGLNEGTGHMAAGRLLWMPLGSFKYYVESDVDDTPEPRLGIGAAYLYNAQADTGADATARILSSSRLGGDWAPPIDGRVDVVQATFDTQFKWRGLSVLGDYYWAEGDPNDRASHAAQGFNTQIGYFLLPKKLEAAFRWSWVNRDLQAGDSTTREIGGALGWFFLAHNLKLQGDVRSLREELPGMPTEKALEYRLQLQAIF